MIGADLTDSLWISCRARGVGNAVERGTEEGGGVDLQVLQPLLSPCPVGSVYRHDLMQVDFNQRVMSLE